MNTAKKFLLETTPEQTVTKVDHDTVIFDPAHHRRVFKHIPFFPKKALQKLYYADRGQIILSLPNGGRIGFRGKNPGSAAAIKICDWAVFRKLAVHGDLGFAECYLSGKWVCDDLFAVLNWGAENAAAVFAAFQGARIQHFMRFIGNLTRRNSRGGSRRNIAAHYDLGNEFYAAWLDASMTYSSALFDAPDQPLEAAQKNKYRNLLQMLNVKPGGHILEIGCGWGGLVEYVLQNTDCSITALTISPAQHAYAMERIAAMPERGRAKILLTDYRDITGHYDAIASIEMFEAVGEAYWQIFADKVHALLKPGCRAALQMISIADERFEYYRKTPDFIQEYIFPGGMLIAPGKLYQILRSANLSIAQTYNFGSHYAETLRQWHRRFISAWPKLQTRKFDARFKNMWEYYLAYCEAGFNNKLTDVIQIAVEKPKAAL